jgi:plasmid maintenance system killer protein
VLGSGTPAALKWSAKTTPTTARALPIITPSGYITANTLTRYTTLRYESLRGFHSIRINDQWRIVFRWIDSGSAEVDIRDYH